MNTLWDSFGLVASPGHGDSDGMCGLQRVLDHVFSRDRMHLEDEETHRCILHFPSMREFFTHEEVELALIRLGWKPLSKRGGWRRYFKAEEPTLPHGAPTIAKLPARSFVDAPKPIILDFVRTVNKRENKNLFCCWYVIENVHSLKKVLRTGRCEGEHRQAQAARGSSGRVVFSLASLMYADISCLRRGSKKEQN